MFDSKQMMLVLALLLAAPLHAQTKCPPLPEGATCDHYHYHVAAWNIESHTHAEIAARQFVSVAACEKARGEALRKNAVFAEFIKTTKIDTSMMPNRFGECHCDRSQETSSPAFLDAKARTAQFRAQQDAAWSLRERLLAQSVPGAGDHLIALFGRPPATDRFFRETMPPRPPSKTPPTATLLDPMISSQPVKVVISGSLVPVPALGAPPAPPPQTQPAAVKPPAQSLEPQPPGTATPTPQPTPGEPHSAVSTPRNQ